MENCCGGRKRVIAPEVPWKNETPSKAEDGSNLTLLAVTFKSSMSKNRLSAEILP
jgi:hypothetical protein